LLKEFKNYNEIKISNNQIQGNLILKDDLDLIWINKNYISNYFNVATSDNIELTVYDMDDNFLFSKIINTYQINNSSITKITLFPGKDLRENGFIRGQYRIVYNFFRNLIGDHQNNKLYIKDISPSRKEIRLLVVETSNTDNNNNLKNNFSSFELTKDQYINLFINKINNLNIDNIIQDKSSNSYEKLNNTFISLTGVTKNKIISAINQYNKNYLSIEDQKNIIKNSEELIFKETYGEDFDQNNNTMIIYQNYIRVIESYVFTNNYKGNLNFSFCLNDGRKFIISNWIRDKINYPKYPYSIILKLYEPLPKDVKEKMQGWIAQILSNPIIDKVYLYGKEKTEDTGYKLKPANFNIEVANLSGRSTGFESWEKLISTQPSTSQDILNKYFSSSINTYTDVNIDFSDYRNFVRFGSAEKLLKNFKYKMEQLDIYNEQIKKTRLYATGVTGSIIVSQSLENYRVKIREIINGFNFYEHHLYYSSGSSYSGSLYNDSYLTHNINEWPKKSSVYPYSLYELTSSTATNWYNEQLTIAQTYDIDNIDNIINNIPTYLNVDENNEDYINFIYMIGEFYDIFYIYINHLAKIHNRNESINSGLAKDLTYHVAKSYGFDLYNGNDNSELWKWAFGYNETGSYYNLSVSGSGERNKSHEDVSIEIWRRILNNLPYILKTKGTAQSIYSLFNCYGIPSSLLTIREFGGPDPRDYEDIEKKSSWIFDDFVYSINFKSSQSISFSWTNITQSAKPESIEFRFASAPSNIPTQSLVSATNWSINLLNSGSGYGYIQYKVGTAICKTEKYRYYDNEFNSVLLRKSGSVHQIITKKAESDHIVFYSSASVAFGSDYNTNDTVYIGGNAYKFTGSIQEFRLYQTALSESTFNNHVRWSKSYNSNTPQRTYYDLVLRYSFDDPKNHFTTTTVSDIKSNQSYTTAGTANGFSNEVNYTAITEEFAALSPQIGGGKFINNKIRFDDNEIFFGDLNSTNRVEKSIYDRAPVDSPKLGIYFSPNDSINKDIIATYAGIDLAGEMGDPRDIYYDKYQGLQELNLEYWKKYKTKPQINEFIKVIKNYDQSLFNHLRSLIPARAKPIIGILIEPYILERNKTKWREINNEILNYESNTLFASEQLTMSIDYQNIEGAINVQTKNIITDSEFLTYNSEIDCEFYTSSSGYTFDMIKPIQEVYPSGSWIPEYREMLYNLWYGGTINTRDTTLDGEEPVIIYYTNPNTLKVTDVGPSKIRVE